MDQSLPDQPQTPIENVPVESIASPEVAEKAPVYENPVAPVAEAVRDEPVQPVAAAAASVTPDLNVVDMRTSHEQTHAAADGVQKLTTIADKEEDDFIQDVERTHSHT